MPGGPNFRIVADMTYLITTNHAGDPEAYRKVVEHFDGPTAGLVARYAGMNDHGLAITSVWESKAHSDRFAAEQLAPALRVVVGDVDLGPSVVVDFEAFDVHLPQTVVSGT